MIIILFMQAWEGRAYDYGMANLKSMGFPVDGLTFDQNLVKYLFKYQIKFRTSHWPTLDRFIFFCLMNHSWLYLQVIRGLIMDKERGNLVKADRFGYVKRAMHGTHMLSTRAVRCGQAFLLCSSFEII